jgi:hypothetical protein
MHWSRGRDPVAAKALQRFGETIASRIAIVAPCDYLANQTIVVGWNLVSRLDMGIDSHVLICTERDVPSVDHARAWSKSVRRIFRVDSALDGVSAGADVFLGEPERLAAGDPNLRLDEIDSRSHLRDRMLDL